MGVRHALSEKLKRANVVHNVSQFISKMVRSNFMKLKNICTGIAICTKN